MPVAFGTTSVTAVYRGSTLIADLRHGTTQIPLPSGPTVPDAPTGVAVTVIDNEGPTAITLSNQTASLAEDTDTTSRIHLADITLTDDGMGTNVITVDNPTYFEIYQGNLYLVAGASLDYETATSHSCTISAVDSTTNDAAVTQAFNLTVTDVLELAPPDAPTGVAVTVDEMPATTDQYYSDVSLLLQESYNDESSNGLTVVWPAGITVSSAAAYTGANGFDVTGNGTAVRAVLPVDSVLEFPDDFTIEAWVKPAAMDYFAPFISWSAVSTTTSDITNFAAGRGANSGHLVFVSRVNGTLNLTEGTTDLRDSNWHHIAVVRSGGTVQLYVDGLKEGTPYTETGTIKISGGHIGDTAGYYANATDNEWRGQFDMLRITKGVARYTTNFSPPTTAFPTTAPVDQYFSDVSLLLQNSLSDESLQGRTLVINGNTALSATAPKYGSNAISMGAQGDYISTTFYASSEFTGEFTAECWIKTTVTGSNNEIIFSVSTPVATGLFLLGFSSGNNMFTQLANYATSQVNATSITDGDWHHVATVRDATHLRLYFDGVEQRNVAVPLSFTYSPTNLEFRIGAMPYSNSRQFIGEMDDVRITRGVARYPNGTTFTPPTAEHPRSNGDAKFSDVSLLLQDSLTDESPQGQTLTVSGNTAATTVESKFGSSISFDGSGDWITASPDPSLVFGTSPFTVEFWMYWDGTVTGTPWMGVMGAHNGNGVNRYGIFMNANGITHYIQTAFPAVSAFPANQWVHIASTRDASGICRFFIDGVLKSTVTDTGNLTATQGFRVGNDFDTNRPPFSGYLDDIRVTRGVARHTANFTPPTAAFPN